MDELHTIHSRGGRIGGRADTSAEDVDKIVDEFAKDQRRHLIIHFHGGLVSKGTGLEIAARLTPEYQGAGYPIFYVWESGAWETIRNNLTELAGEPVFKQLFRKILQYVLEHLGGGDGARSVAASGLGTQLEEVSGELNRFWANPAKRTLPYHDFAPIGSSDSARSAAVTVDENEIRAEIESDQELMRALATLPGVPAGQRSTFGGEAEVRSSFSLMVSQEFSADPNARGLIEIFKVAKYLVKVLRAVLKRYSSKRDHGLHATCIEELIRGFDLGGSAMNEWGKALQWNRMKQDTADAFGPDPNIHAGTALLVRLAAARAKGAAIDRISLIGHSTGAIYIAHWLAQSRRYLPDVQQDIIYLAPAISYDLFAHTLDTCAAQIGKFRMFAMQDSFEREDQVWGSDEDLPDTGDWRRFLYPSSLLYLVSGILESRIDANGELIDEADMPLVGMQRYFQWDDVYPDEHFPSVARGRAWLKANADMCVWSKTGHSNAGISSACIDHGGFDNEAVTLASLRHILR